MRKLLLAVIGLCFGVAGHSQVLNTESFNATTFVPTGWALITTSTSATWSRVVSGTLPTTSPHSGAGMAKFNSYTYSTGDRSLRTPAFSMAARGGASATVSFWMYRDNGYASSADRVLVYINTSSAVGGTLLGTVNRSRSLSPVVSSNGWYQYTFTIPSGFTGATNYILFRGISAYGNNIYIDDIAWQSYPPLPACSGTPTAGTVVGSVTSGCSDFGTTLSLSGGTTGVAGLTYQWQSSSDNSSWSNVSGATSSTYAATISGPVYYRCTVTCSNSGLSSTSSGTYFELSSCYTMTFNSTASTTTCGGLLYDDGGPAGNYNASAGNSIYTLYPAAAGTGAKVTITFNSFAMESGWDYVYIYNGNSTGAPLFGSYTGSGIPPSRTSTATDGSLTVRLTSDGSFNDAGFAATITVSNPNPITAQPTATTNTCQGYAPSISTTTNGTNTYQWYNRGTVNSNSGGTLIAGATNNSYSPPTTAVGFTYYYCVVTNACGVQFTTNTARVNVNATPSSITSPISGMFSSCVGATTFLSSATGGGVWSTSSGVASVNSGGMVTAGGSAGTTTVSYTVAGCAATATFAVNGSPAAIAGASTVCTGVNITLTNPGGVGAWTSSNTAVGTVGAATGVVSGLTPGTTTIGYSNGCGTPASKIITVLQTPTISGAAISCEGSSTTLTGNTGGTWSSSVTAVGTIASSTGVFAALTTGTTNISYTLGNGCVVAVQQQTVNLSPSAFSVSPSTSTICSTGPAQLLTASTSSVPNDQVVGTELNLNDVNTGGSGDYPSVFQVYYSAERCQFMVRASELTSMGYEAGSTITGMNFRTQQVNAAFTLPQFQIRVVPTSLTTLSSFITSGLTTLRPAANYVPVIGDNIFTFGSPYTWNGTDNLVFEVTFNTFGGWSSSPSYRQWWTPTAYQSCLVYRSDASTDPTTVTSINFSYNARPTFTLYGTSPAATTWSGLTGLFTNSGASTAYTGTATQTVYALPSATSTYTASATYSGCSRTSTATVTIPTINTYNVTGSGSYCSGGSGIVISLSGSQSGISYALKNGATTVDTKAGTGSAISFAAQTAAATYTVLATSSSPTCTKNMTGSATVVVNPLPTAVTVAPTSPACNSVSLSASNGSSGTIYYQGTTSGGTSTATAATTANATSSGTYYFRAQSALGCWGTQGSTVVTVNPNPDVSNFSTSATSVCLGSGSTVTVNSTSLGNGTYTVTYNLTGVNTATGATASLTIASNTGTFSVPGVSLGTSGGTTITITNVQNSNSCNSVPGSGNTAAFTIYAPPATVTGSGAGTFCGSTSIGGANGSDGSIFFQNTTSNGTSTALGSSPQTVSATGTYYFRARSADGCWGTQGSVAVTINTIPTAAPTNNGPICVGGTATLNANPATGASTYSWSGPGAFSSTAQNPAVSPTATSVYSLTVTDGSGNAGCSPATVYTTQVTVRPKPIAAPANNGYICNGGTVTLTANPAGGANTYAWSGSSVSSATAENPTATPTSTSIYSLTVSDGTTDNGCAPTDIYTTSVTVNAKPTAAPTNNGYICNGGTVSLTANPAGGATTYAWSGTTVSSASAENPTATPTATSVYSLTVSDGSTQPGCAPTDIYTTSVTVNAKPVATPVNNGPICSGGTVTLTATPAGGANTYNWSGSSLSSASVENPTATPTVTAVYSLTVSDGSTNPGCAPSDVYTTSVTVKSKPAAAPTNNGYICNGGTVTLTSNPSGGATVYTWAGAALASTTAENPTASPTVTSIYSLTVTDGSGDAGCSPGEVYTTSVTVNDKPIAAPTNNGYICNGGTVTLTAHPADGANTYTWSGSALATSTAENPTATPTATGIYSLTVSDGSTQPGCAPSDIYTTSVTVNAKPVAAPVNDGPICDGGTVNLTATPAGGANTYAWSGSNVSSASAENPTATPTVTAVYSLTVSDGSTQSGCAPSDVYTTSVTVRSKPTAAPANNGYICVGGVATLTANPSGGANTFTWVGSSLIDAASTQNPTANPVATAIYSLTVSDGTTDAGCAPADIYTTSVTVNAKPIAAPVNSGVLCNGGTVTLNATPSGGANTYTWSGSALATSTAQNPTATPTTGSYVYSLTVSDGSTQPGCAPADIYTTAVTVNPAPALTSVTNDGQVCEGITLNFSANGATDVTDYSWAGPVVLTNGTTATPSVPGSTTAATGVYSVTVSNGVGSGCAIVYTNSATVNLVPSVASITPSTTNICIGTSLDLNAGAATGAGALTSYNWSGPNGYSTTTGSGAASFMTTTTAQSGVYTLSVTYPGTGCTSPDVTSSAVTVNALPTMVSIGVSPTVMCAGSVLTLTGNGAFGVGSITSYNWTGPNSYSSTSAAGAQLYTTPDDLASGSYSVTVTYTGTGCTSNPVASTVITVNPLPTVYAISGGGFYCSGGTGVNIGIEDSDPGINYQLYNGSSAVGVPLPGNGGPLDYGLITASGTYSILATNTTTSCTNPMGGTTDVSVGPVPIAYNVTGGGGYCAGGAGVAVGVSNGDVSVSYQLYRDGTAVGSGVSPSVAGAFNFGTYTTPGNYTVIANPSATCARTMNGSATISINPLPNIYTLSGGGGYCAGAEGVHLVQDFSVVGIDYQLYRGAALVGAPVAGANSAIDFGIYTTTGTYSVLATNTTTGCTNVMNGNPVISIDPLPVAQTVTGGGNYCSGTTGVSVGLAATESGVDYQLYNGSTMIGTAVAGTGGVLSFGTFTAAGTYSVQATNATTGCKKGMTGTAVIAVDGLPTVYAMNGGGQYCAGSAGVHIGMVNSDLGVNYALYTGATLVTTVPGAAAGVDFGFITGAGTYTVLATNTATGCVNPMTGSATVVINPVPVVHAITGGGTICEGGGGLNLGVSGSNSGISYQLYNGATAVGSPLAGNTLALNFGPQYTGGTYTVLATNTTTSCTSTMSGTAVINVNPAPTQYAVTGGGQYCAGGSGHTIGLAASENGVQYQLYNGAAIASGVIPGDGNPINFGVYTASGTYSVLATNITTFCTGPMSGSAVITINSNPSAFSVTGGGTYCAGGSGVSVGLMSSASGVNYQLYVGSVAEGAPVTGGSGSINFGLKTAAGSYSVMATNSTTGCSTGMTGSATVNISPLPPVYSVTGGGNYCSGGTGSAIGLSGSDIGINYRLYMGATPVGGLVAGTGGVISLGNQTSVGTYSVLAINGSSSCSSAMSGTATVGISASPSAYSVSGGGNYCAGGSGNVVGLLGSVSGVDYQLYRGATTVGTPVSGTGSSLNFGSQTVAGTYTVRATDGGSGCSADMTGSVVITIDPLPVAQTMSGGGQYCSGGTGVNVGMLFTNAGVNYQLYNGATAVGSSVAGTSSPIDFGLQTDAGTYTVMATDAITGCSNNMNGSAVVVVNPLPVVQTVTGGGSFCSDGSGVAVGLSGSESGINYQLYNGSTATGMPIGGTGAAFSFGTLTAAGNYTVQATNSTTACVRNMNGSANVVSNPAPVVYNVTGGGTLCTGQAGYHIGLSGSDISVVYNLYNGSTATGISLNGTGSALDFGTFAAAGIYTVQATNSGTGCMKDMSGGANVVVNALPTAQTVTGGGSFCNGGSGVTVGIGGTQTGVSYSLYRGASLVTTATGTGAALSFGAQNIGGTYSVLATNTTTGCSRNMTGAVGVTVNALPAVQTVTGGGSFCAGGTGVTVALDGSQTGVAYQLYGDGAVYGSAAAGTGSAISFGSVDVAGTYTVGATNYSTGCVSNMSGAATVIINALPTAYAVSGGGSYCTGGNGVTVNVAGSASGVSYQLYNGSTASGTAIAGTGSAISFANVTGAGTYTVLATNTTTGCTRAMTGSTAVTILPLPVVHTVTGGGTYCNGGAGVNIGLSSSNTGINYQLYNGAAAIGSPFEGTGLTFDFGLQTATGTYTVLATNIFTGCTKAMSGSTTIGTTPLPVAHTVTGGGTYCAGGAGMSVVMSGSENGMSYQLYRGATITGVPVTGTGSSINFGLQTTAGTYTVLATNTLTGCTNAMTGSAAINVNAVPVAQTVTGGGSYCNGGSGVAVGLGSSVSGTTYQLYYGSTASGAAVAGTGTSLAFGNMTATGTYSVRATITATGCTSGMTGTATVTTNPLPTLYSVTGGGSYCNGGSGAAIGLSGSGSGISYALYRGATLVATAPGNGSALSFGLQSVAGSYSVVATNTATACVRNMTGSATISINSLPVTQTVTGGGSYCSGETGLHVSLAASEGGVSYQLYRNGVATGAAMTGTGTVLDFGAMTAAGSYSVAATNNTTACTSNMSGTAIISINALPAAYTVTGGGSYCNGSAGVATGLSSSDAGVVYQLYNGSTATGLPVNGTGSAISFGMQTAAGTYTVSAVNGTTGCTSGMTGSTSVMINPLPTAYTMTGGGSYCAGGNGVNVTLSGSGSSITYQLYNGATAIGAQVSGTGSSISFGLQTAAGAYSVLATNSGTGCTKAMNGTSTVIVNAQPTVFTVTGGGAYCAGAAGQHVGLGASAIGVNYQLYYGNTATGSPVAGTGGALDFGLKAVAGTYSVAAANATTGCGADMSGAATISINALPLAQTVTGGGNYCAGGTGVFVNMNGSQAGVDYQLSNGATAVGAAMPGTGGGMSFGLQTAAGTYTVLATNAGTGCTKVMSSSATVVVNALPAVYNMTGGGSYCAGGNGMSVGLSGSQAGVSYKLYNGTTTVGSAVAGTGSAISFGMKTAAGSYTVLATSAAGCTSAMAGASVITINAVPVTYTITGGGNYCSDAAGVSVGLSGSQNGISYQLYNGSAVSGTSIAGTGSAIDFGLMMATGTYSVRATNGTTACVAGMSGTVAVNVNNLPAAYTVAGGGSYCNGGNGVNVSLSASQTGISYQLYEGGSASGSAVAGTGTAISFGNRTAAGVYTVKATNTFTGCINNMNGSATITVNDLPVAQTLTGGGDICVGAEGAAVVMTSSENGISYRLYNGASAIGSAVAGTGVAINFGAFTTAGTYSVLATNMSTGCTAAMSGMPVIVVNPLPAVYSVTGGGNYCAGGNGVYVGTNGSQPGVNYHLYNGTTLATTLAGTGTALNFGRQTAAGMYTVVAENATTACTRNMTGSSTVTVTALPVAYAVNGGGAYCAGSGGVHVGLEGSQTGMNYQLYNGAVASGSVVAGTGTALDFGMKTADGTYTVKATDAVNGCVSMMTGDASVVTNQLPVAHTITGGGSYCAGGVGQAIGLDGSEMNINYVLYRGTEAVTAPVAGTGTALNFGMQTVSGNYTVMAMDATTACSRVMSGTAAIITDALPVAYDVASGAASYCAGGAGVELLLNSSDAGISYTLYNGASQSGAAVAGNGGSLSFGNRTAAGTYTVKAMNNVTGCVRDMNGSAAVVINPLPAVYPVNGGGAICSGAAGVAVGLAGSESGVNYILKAGSATIGAPMAGTGTSISFGAMTTAATYYVTAVNATTGCMRAMSSSATVAVNPLPTAYVVSGGGSYCTGGNGVHVGLNGSASGIAYQLYKDGTTAGAPVAGNGAALDFGILTGAGSYSVMATNSTTGCVRSMDGAVTVSVNALPDAVTVTGGGSFCAGGTGVAVGISGSATGVSYRLYRGSTAIATANGNGSAVSFGTYSVAGVYTVQAVNTGTGCMKDMSGTATVVVNALPVVQTVSGGGSYCAGGTGVNIGIASSQSGVQYQLYHGTTAIGGTVVGTGSAISFGAQTAAGTYTVQAMNSSSCGRGMSGSATVSITPVVIPSVSLELSTETTICAGTEVTYNATSVNGGAAASYSWMVNGMVAGSGLAYTYTPTEGDVVSVDMSSSAACAMPSMATASVSMTVNNMVTPAVSITADHSGDICRGTSVTFSAEAVNGGTAPAYSWTRNGILQSTGAIYTVAPNDGDVVACMLTSNAACATTTTANSNELSSSVVDPLNTAVQITADATTIVEGQPVTFSATLLNAGTAPEVQWLINGAEVSGANTLSFLTSLLKDLDTVSIRVMTSGPCGDKFTFASLVVNFSSVGVTTVAAAEMDIRIMPNPNNGTFVIKGDVGANINGDVHVEVTNMLGQSVYRNVVRANHGNIEQRISLEGNLSNGMYLLNIIAGDQTKVFPVTVGR